MNSDELRTAYLSFFEGKGHKIIPSASLIPQGDPTLLLTSAGMVQFKSYFLGETMPPARRLASCQKCFRTTDIESVGDATHLTFFEMLGNFSIGDYFKAEAISWAWEFVTERLRLLPSRLWITVFHDDDEAFHHWREQGVPEERIVRLGERDNFWGPAGDSGPCGPCSEIHYDFGEGVGCRQASCAPGCNCGRFSEIWNLVFTQYNQDKEGHRTPLPKPNIDTGMGLERTAAVIQGKTSVYETDLFAPLLECISKLSGKRYGADEITDNALRAVAEHSRGIAFLIADGVMPDNEGRGYVLRRLLRRAALFGRRLGLVQPFLVETASVTIQQMGHIYPELAQRRDFILRVIGQEEERFGETLSSGLEVLAREMSQIGKTAQQLGEAFQNIIPSKELKELQQVVQQWVQPAEGILSSFLPVVQQFQRIAAEIKNSEFLQAVQGLSQQLEIPGKEAFKLYDTYGFPVELTREIAASRGFSVDLAGFEQEMKQQRERSRAAQKIEYGAEITLQIIHEGKVIHEVKSTPPKFVGYHTLKHKSKVANLLVGNESLEKLQNGQEAGLILESTPFYGEMGGQVGDTGEIRGSSGRFVVTNTVRMLPDSIVHQGRVIEGSLAVGDEVEAEVDRERRLDIARNHTATHLLQAALREVVGGHIQQRGSLVAPERLRFDFSHLVALTKEEIGEVQRIVNGRIRQNLAVNDEEIPYQQAIKEGALALFDEKYGDVVRVLRIGRPPVARVGGEPPMSTELCGGTHIATTGEIGFFHIVSESSIGAGLRRLEAVTGRGAEGYIARCLADLEKVAQSLSTKLDSVVDRAASIVNELGSETKRRLALERELALKVAEDLARANNVIHGIPVNTSRVEPTSLDNLRAMSDFLQNKMGSGIVLLGTLWDGKPAFVANVSPDLVARGYRAGEIVKRAAAVTGGSGGGRANIAQGGGKDKNKLDEALQEVVKYIEEKHSS